MSSRRRPPAAQICAAAILPLPRSRSMRWDGCRPLLLLIVCHALHVLSPRGRFPACGRQVPYRFLCIRALRFHPSPSSSRLRPRHSFRYTSHKPPPYSCSGFLSSAAPMDGVVGAPMSKFGWGMCLGRVGGAWCTLGWNLVDLAGVWHHLVASGMPLCACRWSIGEERWGWVRGDTTYMQPFPSMTLGIYFKRRWKNTYTLKSIFFLTFLGFSGNTWDWKNKYTVTA
jgi:hypothetical protein